MNEVHKLPPYFPKIPARYAHVKWEDVPEKLQKVFVEIPETRRGIYIHGKVGTGKTHIAYTLYYYANEKARIITEKKNNYGSIDREVPLAKFWNSTELLRDIRLDFDRERSERRASEEELMEHEGILFLDDIGSEKPTDWVLETFYLVINKRYNEKLPIIFTSNCNLRELANKIGGRIASRIAETCEIYETVGEDRRLKK